jgi:alkanesulfonate monooxygenase SsuD/methylene tetrahydromethanopterin reductase-like flavin-dependent oxidoreductase (luciferase family)
MKFAINVPNFGDYADPRFTAALAAEAEASGWDGFHVWDHINGERSSGVPMADPWVLLTAIALATKRIRIGTMVTPVARRRP